MPTPQPNSAPSNFTPGRNVYSRGTTRALGFGDYQTDPETGNLMLVSFDNGGVDAAGANQVGSPTTPDQAAQQLAARQADPSGTGIGAPPQIPQTQIPQGPSVGRQLGGLAVGQAIGQTVGSGIKAAGTAIKSAFNPVTQGAGMADAGSSGAGSSGAGLSDTLTASNIGQTDVPIGEAAPGATDLSAVPGSGGAGSAGADLSSDVADADELGDASGFSTASNASAVGDASDAASAGSAAGDAGAVGDAGAAADAGTAAVGDVLPVVGALNAAGDAAGLGFTSGEANVAHDAGDAAGSVAETLTDAPADQSVGSDLIDAADPVGATLGNTIGDTGFGQDLGCFITEAVMSAGGQDDGTELETLRDFRDKVMMTTPQGSALVEEYNAIAPLVVQAVSQRPDGLQIFQNMKAQFIDPAVAEVQKQDFGGALQKYAEMIAYATQFLAPGDNDQDGDGDAMGTPDGSSPYEQPGMPDAGDAQDLGQHAQMVAHDPAFADLATGNAGGGEGTDGMPAIAAPTQGGGLGAGRVPGAVPMSAPQPAAPGAAMQPSAPPAAPAPRFLPRAAPAPVAAAPAGMPPRGVALPPKRSPIGAVFAARR